MTDITLTQKVKSFAFKEGASLVGIAPVSRWKKAPIQHSPQGVFPQAKTVVVCAIHIPDACVELGSEKDPREPGPGLVLVDLNSSLDYLGFRIAKFLEEAGWQAIPIPVTGLWNYRTQTGDDRGWKADISHFYAAVCAGLGEIGWHNLCITPEFGARQRFISILTDAPLYPDPVYSGEPLCDRCLLCAKNCPTKSFDKEVSGNCTIEIEDKRYTFPKRNLWRCAIGENFQLDVLKDWPEKIDEKVIIEAAETAVTEHPEWIFGWKMGICMKWCINPKRRYFDKKYCSSPRRRRDMIPDNNPGTVKNIINEAMSLAYEKGVDFFATADTDYLKSNGIDIKKELPDAAGAIVIGINSPENCDVLKPTLKGYYIELLLSNLIEKYGYSALVWPNIKAEEVVLICGDAGKPKTILENKIYRLILTSLPVSTKKEKEKIIAHPCNLSPSLLTTKVKKLMFSSGADLVGITPVERVEHLTSELNQYLSKNSDYFTVELLPPVVSKRKSVWGRQAMPFNPKAQKQELRIKKPSEYIKGAKTVIVVGTKLFDASIDYVGKGEGKKAGHYQSFVHGQPQLVLSRILLDGANLLTRLGYKVFPVFGNTDSHYLTANRIAAVAAGLGEIGWSGIVLTPQFGPRQYFSALVTDAPLIEDPLYRGEPLCKRCYKCVSACPAKAISSETPISVSVEGTTFTWGSIDYLRCDWACRYGLLGEAGPKYFNSKTDFPIPANITPEAVCEAIKNSDRIQRPGYTAIVERCFTECPAGKKT